MPRFQTIARRRFRLGLPGAVALGVLPLASCSRSGADASEKGGERPRIIEVADLPVYGEPDLVSGRAIWVENCQNCHLNGREGAPRIKAPSEWAPRLAGGEAKLIANAINGYVTPSGGEMPARGGNDALSDDEVAQAVRYILRASSNQQANITKQ